MRGWKKVPCVNGNRKKAGVAILISDKTEFKTKSCDDIIIVNIYASNIGAPKYIKQIWKNIKGEIDSNIIPAGDFNTPLIPMDRSFKQKINKESLTLNDTLNQVELIDVHIDHSIKSSRIHIFSSAHGTVSGRDHMLDHKTSLN